MFCNVPPSRTACSVGPPRLTSRPPEGGYYPALSWLSWGAIHRQGLCCATLPLLTSFGRTPATGRRAPQRVAVIKRFLGFYDSRSRRRWSRAAKSKPRHEFRQRLSPPFWGARRPDAGVRPNEVRRGDAAKYIRSASAISPGRACCQGCLRNFLR